MLIQFYIYTCVDGQKIAKKLSQQITKETSSMKRLLSEYNSICCTPDAYDFLSFSEALSNGVIEGRLNGFGSSCSYLMTGSRRQIIDAYLMFCRAEEELLMLQKEAKNLLQYYNYREIVISAKLAELSSHDDQFHKGSVAMLKHLQRINRIYYNQAEKTCQSIQNNVATNWSEYCDSDLSDDESDNDFSL